MSQAAYPLSADGFIPRWLTTGLVTSPLTHLADHVRAEGSPFGERGRWALNYWAFDPEVADLKLRAWRGLPPGTAKLDTFASGLTTPPVLDDPAPAGGTWRFARTGQDGVIDLSAFNHTPMLMEGALAVVLHSDAPRSVTPDALTIGPVRVWLNGVRVSEDDAVFSYVALRRVPVTLDLRAGDNLLVVYGVMLGWREARLALGMMFDPTERDGLEARIPIGDIAPDVWLSADHAARALHVRVFAVPDLPARVWCADDAPAPVTVDARVHLIMPSLPSGIMSTLPVPGAIASTLNMPEGSARLTVQPGRSADLPLTRQIAAAFARVPGEFTLTASLRPVVAGDPAWTRHLETAFPVWTHPIPYSSAPYGTFESRRREALEIFADIAWDIPGSLAAVAVGRTAHVNSGAVELACGFLNARADTADFYAVGLVAALYRHADTPELLPADQVRIEEALRGFKYWIDEPGIDAMCYFTENHQILFHTAGYLIGARHPDWTFTSSGLSGAALRDKSLRQVVNWIAPRLEGGFSEWDSSTYMELVAFALLALTEYAPDAQVVDAASRLLDFIFMTLAEQTYRGVMGTSHGRIYVGALRSGRVENTSALCRIAFGMGQYNGTARAATLLALATRYRIPEMVMRRAAAIGASVSTRARPNGVLKLESDMKDVAWSVETLCERTADGMIAAAIDVRPSVPGSPGIQEHLWQATLSPEAVVFTTYPGNAQQHGSARPNYWAGSARMPRVGMLRRRVICLYRLEPGVGMGFTHAYFPTEAFEEWDIDGQWAFARVGMGYIALWGDGDLRLVKEGIGAWCELRSSGAGEAWACRLGRFADDRSYAAFRARMTASPPVSIRDGLVWGDLTVTWAGQT